MKHKVLGSLFILSIALGVFSVAVRMPSKPTLPPSSRSVESLLKDFRVKPSDMKTAMEHKENLARPLSSYKVHETEAKDRLEFHTSKYEASVTEAGFKFGSRDFRIELGEPVLRQGGVQLELSKGKISKPEFGVAQIDRGPVVEKYVFENRGAEQLFVLPEPVGDGAVQVSVPVTSALPGPVVRKEPNAAGFNEVQFEHGGLAFTDATGATKVAYHTAIAMDAAGLRQVLAPSFENGSIVLNVPERFMSRATYPVTIDPWFELAGSASGNGVSGTATVSDRPALIMSGGGLPYVVWSDTASSTSANPNNSDIYMRIWTGFQFIEIAGSGSAGISNNIGRSSNPSMCFGLVSGFPIIAWQDDTTGFTQIFLKAFDGTGWAELAGSASNVQGSGGVSRFIGPSQHPSVSCLAAAVLDADGNQTFVDAPIVAYDDLTNDSVIRTLVFYPGNAAFTTSVPSGWYQLTPGGLSTSNVFMSAAGDPSQALLAVGVNEYPSIDLDAFGNPVVAWEGTANGNYEIYVSRYQLTTTGTAGCFYIAPGAATGFYDIRQTTGIAPPAGGWAAISGSNTGGGISNTPGMSLYPAIAIDAIGGTNNISVVWQEMLPAAPPSTTNQIYLRRSVNLGAWAELAGSGSGLGISQSTGNATAPAIAAGGNALCVVWADDSSGNPEIYARRFFPGLSTQWEQIGFQGSAAPLIGTDTVAPAGGLSQTPNFSLTPFVKIDVFGNPTVAWTEGANGQFDIYLKQFSPNAPGIVSGTNFQITLRQTSDDPLGVNGGTDIPTAGTSSNTTVYLSSRVFTETLLPAGTAIRLDVEVQPLPAKFTGTPTASALIVAPDSPAATPANIAVVPFSGLPNFNYKWQARTVDQVGRRSPWFPFATLGGASFRIDTTATGGGGGGTVTPPPPPLVGNTSNKGSCGLLGLDAVALLGVLSLIRRRRGSK